MAEMIKLFVNGEEVEVESGKNLVDAIGAVGIEIPHLCYHPALGADGNCRLCLVGIEDGRPPLVPACKTPAAEGMKVQLDTEVVKKIQKDIMEFQLINHPIDCPVCDQAGECALQDYYMKYDSEPSRMRVPQVNKGKKMDMGAGVVHDQERCILCGRCVRFCRQITETGELGIVNRTDTARVCTFPGRPLSNRYAQNVVDLCPVGAMTSQDFRFKQRVWFLAKSKSVCHGCSKGCNIYIDHNKEKYKDDVIYRFRPRFNEQVNGYFMCDEGRLSYHGENEGRLVMGLKKGREIALEQAVESAAAVIGAAKSPVILVSPQLSLEQLVAAKALADKLGATLSGYSDNLIKKGDGDDYLIQDDKSANRASLELLGIDCSIAAFQAALEKSDLLMAIGNIRFPSAEKGLAKALRDKKVVNLNSHRTQLAENADVAVPVASYSEYAGCVINCDGILQYFDRSVEKNDPPLDAVVVLHRLGGPLGSSDEIYEQIVTLSGSLAEIDFQNVPAEGVKIR